MVAVSTVVVLRIPAISGAADYMSEKEIKPSLTERLTAATVKGTLMKMERNYYSIQDTTGREVKLYVDDTTKLDRVTIGDKVKAYVEDGGHITTLQRDE